MLLSHIDGDPAALLRHSNFCQNAVGSPGKNKNFRDTASSRRPRNVLTATMAMLQRFYGVVLRSRSDLVGD